MNGLPASTLMFHSPLAHTNPSFECTSNESSILRRKQSKLTFYPACRSTCSNKHGIVSLQVYYDTTLSVLTFILHRKHAQVTESAQLSAAIELADADIEEAKKEWEDLVLSDED
jgi:hypothetical protein